MAKVLIVDDEIEVLETFAIILRSRAHEVVTATDGYKALDIAESGTPLDLLVTDIVMPDLNGFALARMVRWRRTCLPILYVTGFHEADLAKRELGERYGKLLYKPIHPAEFRNEVAAALGHGTRLNIGVVA